MTRLQSHTTPWTPAEEERLRAMIVSGMSVKDIATEHQRNVGAVRSRSERLGISLKRVAVKRHRLVDLGLKAKGR
jgi:DNA-binding NarL/FixJ family response regulator